MAGLFASAQTVETKKPKGRKADTKTVELPGLERYSALKAAMDSIKAMLGIEEAAIKGQMTDLFIAEGIEKKRKPDNFEGVDGAASASCQLKIRSTASVLSDEEQITLMKHKVPFGEIVKQEAAFLINPRYTNDMALLAKVEEALSGVDLPADFLLKQEREVTKVATDASIEAVFTKTADEANILLPLVTTLAVRSKIEGDFWGLIDEIMGDTETEEAEA